MSGDLLSLIQDISLRGFWQKGIPHAQTGNPAEPRNGRKRVKILTLIGGFMRKPSLGWLLRRLHMNLNMKTFLREDSIGLVLYYDMVLIETKRPIFFTCRNNDNKLFACCCYCADGEKCGWIIVPTTAERLICVLTDQMTIREIFEYGEEEALLVTLRAGCEKPEIKRLQVKELPGDILPTAGYCMEAEEGEFADEIEKLRSLDEIYVYKSEHFFAISHSFTVKIKLSLFPHITNSGMSKGRCLLKSVLIAEV